MRGQRQAEAGYIAAVRGFQAIPAGSEHAEARCKARTSIKAAERVLVEELWASGELAGVIDLGRYVESYGLALVAEATEGRTL